MTTSWQYEELEGVLNEHQVCSVVGAGGGLKLMQRVWCRCRKGTVKNTWYLVYMPKGVLNEHCMWVGAGGGGY